MLHSIKDQYIFTSEDIEVYQRRRVVRVTAKRAKAEFIIQSIVEATTSIKKVLLPLDILEPPERTTRILRARLSTDRMFNNSVLKELSQITSTEITRENKTNVSDTSVVYMLLLMHLRC